MAAIFRPPEGRWAARMRRGALALVLCALAGTCARADQVLANACVTAVHKNTLVMKLDDGRKLTLTRVRSSVVHDEAGKALLWASIPPRARITVIYEPSGRINIVRRLTLQTSASVARARAGLPLH